MVHLMQASLGLILLQAAQIYGTVAQPVAQDDPANATTGATGYEWKEAKGADLPKDIFPAGLVLNLDSSSPLIVYAGRAHSEGRFYIGKLYDPTRVEMTLYAEREGKERFYRHGFQVLTIPFELRDEFQWVDRSQIHGAPRGAVSFDVTPEGRQRLMCRVGRGSSGTSAYSYTLGEVLPDTDICYSFWYSPYVSTDYQLLIRNPTKPSKKAPL